MAKNPPRKYHETLIIGLSQEIADLMIKGGIDIAEFNLKCTKLSLTILICISSRVKRADHQDLVKMLKKAGRTYITLSLPDAQIPTFMAISADASGTSGSYRCHHEGIFVMHEGKIFNILLKFVHEKVGARLMFGQRLQDALAEKKGVIERKEKEDTI
jgi:hypothetical protein